MELCSERFCSAKGGWSSIRDRAVVRVYVEFLGCVIRSASDPQTASVLRMLGYLIINSKENPWLDVRHDRTLGNCFAKV